MTDSEFFSPDGLAGYVGVPVGTIYKWNYDGTGPRFVRIGKHVRYRRADVEDWLSERVQEPLERVAP